MEVRLLAEVPYITVEAVVLGFSALNAPWPLCMKQQQQSTCVCHTQRNLKTILASDKLAWVGGRQNALAKLRHT